VALAAIAILRLLFARRTGVALDRAARIRGLRDTAGCPGGPSRARARRALDMAAAVVAILGLVFARSLIAFWAFLLLFSVTTVPERLLGHLRDRRRR
jgi:hypothetical protein